MIIPDPKIVPILARLDGMAEDWANSVELERCIASMLIKPDAATRFRAFIKQAFVEGICHAVWSEDSEKVVH